MSFTMDNFTFVLEARGRTGFTKGFDIAFMDSSKARSFLATADTFTLYWHDVPGATKLPFEMEVSAAEPMVWEWLTKHAVYPSEPDLDGSVSKGFLIEAGHDRLYKGTERDRYAMLKLTAVWAEHHK